MKVRNGFVSNSSSCSYILELPDDRSKLYEEEGFKRWFGIKGLTPTEETTVFQAVVEAMKKTPDLDNWCTLIEYLGNMISYTAVDDDSNREEIRGLIDLFLKTKGNLFYAEIGNSIEYTRTRIPDYSLIDRLGSIYEGKKVFTEHAHVYDNH